MRSRGDWGLGKDLATGFTPALLNIGRGRQRLEMGVRNGHRCIVDSQELSSWLLEVLRPYLPETLQGGPLVDFNERCRVLCYTPGQDFSAHYDACFERKRGEGRVKGVDCSLVTAQLYLHDVPAANGGGTAFLTEDGKKVTSCQPGAGSVLLFTQILGSDSTNEPRSRESADLTRSQLGRPVETDGPTDAQRPTRAVPWRNDGERGEGLRRRMSGRLLGSLGSAASGLGGFVGSVVTGVVGGVLEGARDVACGTVEEGDGGEPGPGNRSPLPDKNPSTSSVLEWTRSSISLISNTRSTPATSKIARGGVGQNGGRA
eukprot:g10430.t1